MIINSSAWKIGGGGYSRDIERYTRNIETGNLSHIRVACPTQDEADKLGSYLMAHNEFLDLLALALPYVEEGEEFNRPTGKTLSKNIRAALAKAGS